MNRTHAPRARVQANPAGPEDVVDRSSSGSDLADRYRLLLDVGRTLTGTLGLDQLFRTIYRETSRVLETGASTFPSTTPTRTGPSSSSMPTGAWSGAPTSPTGGRRGR